MISNTTAENATETLSESIFELMGTFKILFDSFKILLDIPFSSEPIMIATDFLKFESIISNYRIDESEKINLVKKINNSFSNLNFQIDKIIEKQEVNPTE